MRGFRLSLWDSDLWLAQNCWFKRLSEQSAGVKFITEILAYGLFFESGCPCDSTVDARNGTE